MMISRRSLFLLVCLVPLVSARAFANGIETSYQLEILGDDGARHAFAVARVTDRAGQAKGLMQVPSLAPDTGMLFVFDPPRKVGFWMRNTRIPLDMIFIGADGRIAEITTRHDTNSDRLTTSKEAVAAVLEIAAGRAAELGVKAGHIVQPARGGM